MEGTANGRLVIEFAPTRQLKSPVALTVKDGFVEEVSGDEEYAGYLREKLSERMENANIAELGIGTNDMAKRPDNILESEKSSARFILRSVTTVHSEGMSARRFIRTLCSSGRL